MKNCKCDKFFVTRGIHDSDCEEHPINKRRNVNDMTSDLLQDWFEDREKRLLAEAMLWIQSPII